MKKFFGTALIMVFALSAVVSCSKKDEKKTDPKVSATKASTEIPKGSCQYSIDAKDISFEWTAYKFTDKTGVKGSFTQSKISGNTTAPTFAELVQGLSIDIDAASIESGDPGRNLTVKQFFFEKFEPPLQIKASSVKLEGDETQGKLRIKLEMNGVAKEIPFDYKVEGSENFIATASFDMMDFNLKTAYDSIHQACKTLHTGPDGVAKTWTTVDLSLKANYHKECR